MPRWFEFPLTAGAVNSRPASSLRPGEFSSTSGVKYKASSDQLHPDLGYSQWPYGTKVFNQYGSNYDFRGPFYLSFENAPTDWLMMVYTEPTLPTLPGERALNVRIMFTRADGTSAWILSPHLLADNVGNSSSTTGASITHWGDRYYLATDQGCVEIAPPSGTDIPTVRRLGFLGPDGSVMRRINLDTTPATTGARAIMTGTNGSDFVENDIVSIFITEYDANTGIESAPVWGGGPNELTASNRYLSSRIPSSLEGKGIAVTFPDSFYNSDATTFRAYIKYWGLATVISGSSTFTNQFVDEARVQWYEEAVVGASLLTDGGTSEFGVGEIVTFVNIEKGVITNPLPVLGVDNARLIFPAFRYPSTANVAAVWNDSLVLNDSGFHNSDDLAREASAIPAILRYSPPGEPFNQPVPYFLNFASEREDDIKALKVVNDRLLVLCDSAVHSVRYLPFNNLLASQQGRVKDVVTTNIGLASANAAVTVETARGEMCVWLSVRGLEWSDGMAWDDACADFKVPADTSSEDLADAVLVNLPSEYRVDLYLGKNLYSFYYHPSHLKDGRLKMLGPTALDNKIFGACEYQGTVYRFDGDDIYWTRPDSPIPDGVAYTGHIRGSNPFKDMEIFDLGLSHTSITGSVSMRCDGAVTGNALSIGSNSAIPNPELEEVGAAGISQRGTYVRFRLEVDATADYSVGPIWINGIEESGGNG